MTGYCSTYSTGGSGLPLEVAKTVGSFNVPYGTRIYIPYLKNKWGNKDGIITVTDTGVLGTDFDLYLRQNCVRCKFKNDKSITSRCLHN